MVVPPAFVASFLVLAAGGFVNAGYLWWKHHAHANRPLVCPMNHDCSVVTESKWNTIFYFRNETLGALYFALMFAALVYWLVNPFSVILTLILLASVGAFLFSLLLVGIQAFVIKDYCFYCLVSAVITTLLFVNSIALL